MVESRAWSRVAGHRPRSRGTGEQGPLPPRRQCGVQGSTRWGLARLPQRPGLNDTSGGTFLFLLNQVTGSQASRDPSRGREGGSCQRPGACLCDSEGGDRGSAPMFLCPESQHRVPRGSRSQSQCVCVCVGGLSFCESISFSSDFFPHMPRDFQAHFIRPHLVGDCLVPCGIPTPAVVAPKVGSVRVRYLPPVPSDGLATFSLYRDTAGVQCICQANNVMTGHVYLFANRSP